MKKTNDTESPMRELETDPQLEQNSLWQKIQIYYDFMGCWALHLMFLCSPLVFLFMCFESSLRVFALAYLLWMYYDRETQHTGGRRLNWLRKLRFWRHRRDYFPVELVKTAELPPDNTYLFASFPHGFLTLGASTNFLTDANRFEDVFPGLNVYACSLETYFKIPFVRELLLFLGVCTCSPKSILHVLNKSPGNAAVLTVGGMAEMIISFPGTNRLVLKNRKGFVKIALKAGSFIVPVYTFGEPDTYDQPFNGPWYERLQKIRPSGSGAFAFFKGPCKLSHLFGLLPYQIPLTTVVGKPIQLPKVEDPSSEIVDKYHEIFVEEITQLFEKYKTRYDTKGENAILSIE